LHELTTGARLFDGDNEYEVLKKLLELPIPEPSSFCPGYPPELERIVMKGLERDPALRYQTARALSLDLERFAAHSGLMLSPTVLAELMFELFGAPRSVPPMPVERAGGADSTFPPPSARGRDRETLSTTDLPARAPAKPATLGRGPIVVLSVGLLAAVALLGALLGIGYLGLQLGRPKVPALARLPVPELESGDRYREQSAADPAPASESPEVKTSSPPRSSFVGRRSAAKTKPKTDSKAAPLSEKAVLDAPLPK
jgi:hypothetical protein